MTWAQAIDYLLSIRSRASCYEGNGFPWPLVSVVDAAIVGAMGWQETGYKAPDRIYCKQDRAIYFEWGDLLDPTCWYFSSPEYPNQAS